MRIGTKSWQCPVCICRYRIARADDPRRCPNCDRTESSEVTIARPPRRVTIPLAPRRSQGTRDSLWIIGGAGTVVAAAGRWRCSPPRRTWSRRSWPRRRLPRSSAGRRVGAGRPNLRQRPVAEAAGRPRPAAPDRPSQDPDDFPQHDGRRLRRLRRRWVVEQIFGWLKQFRRLNVRWEYYSAIFHGFA